MGYTTTFKGSFTLDKPLSFEHAAILKAINDESDDIAELSDATHPDGYFQWVPTKDRKGIQWDGNEKFYDYVEWLQWLIDALLAPWGYALSGKVTYRGEDRSDIGVLRVVDGVATKDEGPTSKWSEIPAKLRARLIERLNDECHNLDLENDEADALNSALALLAKVRGNANE